MLSKTHSSSSSRSVLPPFFPSLVMLKVWPFSHSHSLKILDLLLTCESESHSVLSDSLRLRGLYSPWNSAGQNTGVGSLSVLQGIFPTQGSNLSLLHCRQTLYQLSHQRSPSYWHSHCFKLVILWETVDMVKWKWKLLSCVRLFVTPWTIQSMEFCRPEYWSG